MKRRLTVVIVLISLAGALAGGSRPRPARAQPAPDGGVSWASLGALQPLERSRSTAIAGPSLTAALGDPDRLAYCAPGAVQTSGDGGATWTALPVQAVVDAAAASPYPLLLTGDAPPTCTSLVLDPSQPSSVYAVFRASKAPFGAPPIVFAGYVTTDGGQTWQSVPVPEGVTMEQFGGFRTRDDGAAVEALFAVPGMPGAFIVEESGDRGATWQAVALACPTLGPCLRWGPAPNMIGSCSMNARIQPIMASLDGGATWTPAPLFGSTPVNGVDACVRNELAPLSDTGTLLLAEDAQDAIAPGALNTPVLQTRDGGQTWTAVALPPLPGGSPQALRGLLMLPWGALIVRPQQAPAWQLLAPGASSWCAIPAAALGASYTTADTVQVIGDRVWWLEDAGTSVPPAGAQVRALSVPLAGIECGMGLPEDFTSITFAWCDSGGAGSLTLASQGDDPAINGSTVAATLSENGTTWQGTGLARRLASGVYLLALALASDQAEARFVEGTLTLDGDRWFGQGQAHPVTDPEYTDQWRATALVPPPLGCG